MKIILPIFVIAISAISLFSCNDYKESSSSTSKHQAATTIAETTTIKTTLITVSTTEIPTGTEPMTGLIKHTDRPNEGLYLEDYITVNFKGSEHDSEVEVIIDWNKLAKELGNDITPELLEAVYRIKALNTDDRPIDHTRVDDLVNGDTIELCIYENTLDKEFKKQYSKELKYIEDNVWYYDKTPVIVSRLK